MSFLQYIKRKFNNALGNRNKTVRAPHLTANNNNEQDIYNGSFGFVFRYKNDPKKVFKIYLRNVDIYKERNKANTVFSITRDDRQKVEIVDSLKYNDLPESVQYRIPHHLRNRNLTAIRMNDLGVDLHICMEKHLQQLSMTLNIVPILFAQFYKLIHQVDQLHGNGIYHCDIRLENIMIDVETGIMTLIDFDQIGTLSESNTNLHDIVPFILNGQREITSTWPIEWLVIGNKRQKSRLSNDNLVALYETTEMLELCKIAHKDRIVQDKMNPRDYFKTYLHDVLDRITPIIQGGGFGLSQLMSGFDTFGLGFAFSYFLYQLQRNKTFQANCNDRDKSLIDKALNVAKSMCRFDMTMRATIRESVILMRHFLETNGIPLPASGGRRRRQTRRR